MKTKVKVTFEMSFDTEGECKTTVSFDIPEHPDVICPESIKPLVLGEIQLICGAAVAAAPKLFS